jgi:TolB-like protein
MKKILFILLSMIAYSGLFAQQQPVVAVAPFEAGAGINASDANMITRVFFILLGNTRQVSLVDRNVVDRVIREHNFQAGDWSDMTKTAELARALNANWIVQGEIDRWGTNTLVTVQFFDIQSFQFMGGTYVRFPNADDPYDHIEPLVVSLVETIGGTSSSTSSTVAPTPTPIPRQTYSIGSIGPGGGMIFSISDGGLHKEVNFRNRLGSHSLDNARNIARAFQGGGFNNWRLPAQNELVQIYTNLHRRGLGGFASTWYWSSSGTIGSSYARAVNFSNGNQDSKRRSQSNSVLAVREFRIE